jgi:hypothetical protein
MKAGNRHELLAQFLAKWPLDRVRPLTLEEYALGGSRYKETFCHWVETITASLGNISGISGGGSFKFGIFLRNTAKQYNSNKYLSDDLYAWERKFGEERISAFNQIKRNVIQVIEYSLNKDFNKIDNIEKLFPLFKWKLAFLYSDYSLVPFYAYQWMVKIARGLGYGHAALDVPTLQAFIFSQKPAEIDFFVWCDLLGKRYIHNLQNYFVVGSQYHDRSTHTYKSRISEFYDSSVIATDFHSETSLSDYFNGDPLFVKAFLESQDLEKNKIEALMGFLSIRKGDIVAIKDFGLPNRLKIAAYAIVVEDQNGNIYRHEPDGLGHCINVAYLEKDVELELSITKTHTIHRIVEEEEIDVIFRAYQKVESNWSLGLGSKKRKGTNQKHVSGHQRNGSSSVFVEEFHNQLQQQFFEWLKLEKDDPEGVKCVMEENYVDVSYRDEPAVELYEVKTASTPAKCIKEAFGQLMCYSSRESSANGNLKLFVVGPGEMQQADKDLLDFVKSKLSIEFDYINFPLNKS